jgi:hypothetical protein
VTSAGKNFFVRARIERKNPRARGGDRSAQKISLDVGFRSLASGAIARDQNFSLARVKSRKEGIVMLSDVLSIIITRYLYHAAARGYDDLAQEIS